MQFYTEDKCDQQMQKKSSEKFQGVLCFSEAD